MTFANILQGTLGKWIVDEGQPWTNKNGNYGGKNRNVRNKSGQKRSTAPSEILSVDERDILYPQLQPTALNPTELT